MTCTMRRISRMAERELRRAKHTAGSYSTAITSARNGQPGFTLSTICANALECCGSREPDSYKRGIMNKTRAIGVEHADLQDKLRVVLDREPDPVNQQI